MITQKQLIKKHINDALDWTYTNLPAVVIEYDATSQTAIVQPLINYTWADGVVHEDPPIAEVPVVFPSAGGGIISFPVRAGDTVLLCFSMRSIDEWVEGDGSISTPSENRSHELTDAIAIVGLYPKANSLSPNPDDVEIKFKGNKVTLKANGDVVIEGGKIELGEGATESVVLGDSLKEYLDNHTHDYVNYPAGTTSPTPAETSPPSALPASALSTKVKTI